MVVEGRFMGDDKIRAEADRFSDDLVGGEHGGYDAFYLLAGVTGLDRVDGIGEWGAGNVGEKGVDDLLNGHGAIGSCGGMREGYCGCGERCCGCGEEVTAVHLVVV